MLGMMSAHAFSQSSDLLLSLNYTLNETTSPGLFANPSRATGVYFYSGADFVESAFTIDQSRGTITYIVSRNGVATLFGVYGDQAGEISFNSPEGIDLDASGNLYIADTGNNQVVRMSFDFQTGAFTHVANIAGITNPVEVLITGNSFWVVSASQHQVREYSLSGSSLYSLGSLGSGNGQFSLPQGISSRISNGAISSTDIYVADTGNDRVVMFTKGGSSGTYSAWHAIAIPNSDLYDVSSDPDGNAFVADRGQGRIHVVGWYANDYLGYASENFNQPRNVNFAPGYYDLGVIEAWSTSSGVSRYYTGVEILNLTATPSSTNTVFSYGLIANANMTGTVFNASGQLVKDVIANTALPAYSNHQHTWDGRDNSGNTVPAGQYKFELIANTSHGVDTNFVNFTWTPSVGDTTPPVISSVSASNVSSSGATITWTTNESSDSQVEYGLTASYGSSTTLAPALVTSHSVALSNLTTNTLYHYRVKSRDASGNLATSSDFTFSTSSSGDGGNLALSATASASSEKPQYGQTANKAIDGVIDGWPGDYTKEWASNSEGVGAWLQLNWAQPVTVDRVVMYDRPVSGVQVLGAQLTFSTGSAVNVGALNNNGTATQVTFSSRTVSWLRFTVTSANGADVGLAEIEVFASGGGGDVMPPVISNVASSNITSSGATITWTTNEASDSQVEYGLTASYGSSTTLAPALLTSHSVALSGLTTNTLYHYRVKSRDASGNLATSSDFTFTTSGGGGDVTPPVISSVAASNITSSGATITWTTNESSDSQVEYGLTTSYGSSTTLDPSLVTSHSVALSSLTSNTLYHYRVKSKDASGNWAVSSDFTFTTSSSTSGNIASLAMATASSEKPQWGQTANKAIDGVVDGWPGDYTKEWASNSQGVGAWIQLSFPQAYTINKVVLYDRPTTGVHITAGQLSFSNNSTFNTGSLNNNGTAKTVTFSSRTVTWVRFTVTGASSSDVGLAEMEVWTTGASKAGDEEFSAAQPAAELPLEFELSPVYPNPFAQREGSATQFHVYLPEAAQVSAVIYNVLGEEVQRVYSGLMPAGQHALRWEGRNALRQNVGAGLYLIRVEFVGSSGRREVMMRRVAVVR